HRVVETKESFPVCVEPVCLPVRPVKGVVIAALAEFGPVDDSCTDGLVACQNFNLASGKVSLEVLHIVGGVVEGELEKGHQANGFLCCAVICKLDLVNFSVCCQGHEECCCGREVVLSRCEAGVAKAM